MRLVIAEKPSVGRAIAAAIGRDADTRNDSGCITAEGGRLIITWCFGHLLEQAPPDAYRSDLKAWRTETLPFHVEEHDWKLLPRKDASDQLNFIGRLLRSAQEVVHAGDNDREGQLLVDEVLDYFGWRGPTLRMVTNDLTPAAMRKAWAGLRDNRQFRPVYLAGLCRQRADWLVGMNLTRAASIKIGLTSSVGRVQTPTLAMVVRRDREIEAHTSRHFYTLHATVAARGPNGVTSGTLIHDDEALRIFDQAEAKRLAAALKGQTVEVAVDGGTRTEHAPLPYILATFQQAGEKHYGWTAKQALRVLQSLYEGGWITYPRTDCPYLPVEQAPQVADIVERVVERLGEDGMRFAKALGVMKPSPKVYDDSKVTEHHGIVPTTRRFPAGKPANAPANWGDLERGWRLVATRFLLSLLPAAVYDVREASFTYEDRVFSAKGETIRPGITWRDFDPRETKPLSLDIPPGSQASGRVGEVAIHEGKTTPPKPYTEASLIADMRQAAKFASDPKLKAMLKETAGIGTPATQGEIIETLKQRGYVSAVGRSKTKYLRSTAFGRYLVDNAPAAVADVGVTAAWEQQLTAIAEAKADPAEFMERIKRYVARQTEVILGSTFPPPPKPEEKRHTPPPKLSERKPGKRRRKPRARADV